MKPSEINIRDPFVLIENGTYYLYGTRAENFGQNVGGFDVYTSADLKDFSAPKQCFDSEAAGFKGGVNWAPEVHKYKNKYYMLATFTQENGLRGVFSLVASTPNGPFKRHSQKALTPTEWECLDGTLYINKDGKPYLVFCHEHTQIEDGTICYMPLNEDLSAGNGETVLIFKGSSPYFADKYTPGKHYITDGPFMFTTKGGDLLMMWSTFVNHKYTQCIAKSNNGDITGTFTHLPPIITDDGGHGMIFKAENKLFLTFHTPNQTGKERPAFYEITETPTGKIKLM